MTLRTPDSGHLLKVGEMYVAHRATWPMANEFNAYEANGACFLEWRTFLPRPTRHEVRGFKKGRLAWTFQERNGLLVVTVDVDKGTYQGDATFTPHLVPDEMRPSSLPPIKSENDGYLISCLLIDAETGILRAHRVFTLTNAISRFMRESYLNLLAVPGSREILQQRSQNLYAQFSTRDLMHSAQHSMILKRR